MDTPPHLLDSVHRPSKLGQRFDLGRIKRTFHFKNICWIVWEICIPKMDPGIANRFFQGALEHSVVDHDLEHCGRNAGCTGDTQSNGGLPIAKQNGWSNGPPRTTPPAEAVGPPPPPGETCHRIVQHDPSSWHHYTCTEMEAE